MDSFDGYSSYEAWKVALCIDSSENEYMIAKMVIDTVIETASHMPGTMEERATEGLWLFCRGKILDGIPVTKEYVKEYVTKEIADRTL